MTITPDATQEPGTYRVRDYLLADLTAKFARLAKRADKLGVPAPTFTIVATHELPEYVEVLAGDISGGTVPTGRIITFHDVRVTGEAPKFAGWSMLAVIDRDLDEPNSPNVVHLLPGVELDPTWRDVRDVCDHCVPRDIARGRKLLVVVQHDNGERKIVGTTCLHDFLGHTSPHAIAAWVATLSSFADYFGSLGADDDEREHGGRRIEERYDPEHFLAEVARSIRTYGWVSRGKADVFADRIATVDRVRNDIDRFTKREEPYPTDADKTLAQDAIEWATTIDPGSNDYLFNVQAVVAKSGWRGRDLGIGGSIISAYQREQQYKAEREAQAAAQTEPCPEGKTTITGVVVGTKWAEGYMGDSVLKMTVVDDRGFRVWGTVPSSILADIDTGTRVQFNCTVQPKDDTFGFFKRPTRATVITEATV